MSVKVDTKRLNDAKTVPCTTCGAQANEPCRDGQGDMYSAVHPARWFRFKNPPIKN